MKKIDAYAHIIPQKFLDYCAKHVANWDKLQQTGWLGWVSYCPALWDIDTRLRIMNKYDDYVQVLVPPGSSGFYCSPEDEANIARVYNDAVAEVVSKHPTEFIGAVAYLPLHNIDAALREIDRTIDEMGFKGIYMETPVYEVKESDYEYNYETIKPLDSHEFIPIYERMSRHKLPIWINPVG